MLTLFAAFEGPAPGVWFSALSSARAAKLAVSSAVTKLRESEGDPELLLIDLAHFLYPNRDRVCWGGVGGFEVERGAVVDDPNPFSPLFLGLL